MIILIDIFKEVVLLFVFLIEAYERKVEMWGVNLQEKRDFRSLDKNRWPVLMLLKIKSILMDQVLVRSERIENSDF